MAVDVRINSFYAEAVLLLEDATILRKSFRLVYTKPDALYANIFFKKIDNLTPMLYNEDGDEK